MKFKIERFGGYYFLDYKKHWWNSWTNIYVGYTIEDVLDFKEIYKGNL